MQIIKQTDEEKMAMYMKMPKKKIAEMLIQCNKVKDSTCRISISEGKQDPEELDLYSHKAKWIKP